jgi:hypothetical protein
MTNSEFNRRDFLRAVLTTTPSIIFPQPKYDLIEPETRIPTKGSLRQLYRDPNFWTKLREPSHKPIFVDQWLPEEYPDYEPSKESFFGFRNNACFLASITMARRLGQVINKGVISGETTVLNTYQLLEGATYTAGRNHNVNQILDPSGRSLMSFEALPAALEAVDKNVNHFKETIVITPDRPRFSCNVGPTKLCTTQMTYNESKEAFAKAHKFIYLEGGITFIFVPKYRGHVIMSPEIPEDIDLPGWIFDTRGPNEAVGPQTIYASLYKYAVGPIFICGVVPNLPPRNIPV